MNGDVHLGCPALVRARAQPVTDYRLEPADGHLNSGPGGVSGCFLPGRSAVLGDEPQVAVPLCGLGLGRFARHCRGTRRYDDRRFGMTLCDPGGSAFLVVCAVTRERGHRCSLRQDRRVFMPCFSISHSPAPQSLRPVLSTSRWTGSPSRRGRGRGTSSVLARRHRVVWSGTARASPSRWMREPIRPSVWRRARRNTALSVSAVRIAKGEYHGCPPAVVRGSAFHAATASSVNQTVRLPRWRKAASYAAEFVRLCFCFGMW